MDRKERTEQKMQELFHSHAAGDEGTDGEFMQILQGYIFGDVCYIGSLDNRMRELVTVTVLTALSALPQLKAHVQASLNAGCTPVEIREAVYQCAPFIGFPRTLNAIGAMNEVFTGNGIELPLPGQKTLIGESEDERYQKGLVIQAPLYGTEIASRYTWLPGEFAQAVPRFLTELCFGDFATRSGLDGKTRELLTVVLLAALGGAEAQLKSHVEGALKEGNTKEEVVCALVHAGGYMGIPRLFNALNACKDVLKEN
jgi:4-carboxymuconolactone decarboxylase